MNTEKPYRRRDLLGIRELAASDIVGILDTAENFREISNREVKKVPALRGKTVINLFFENSTRTRTSFELAAKRLSADAVNISISSSSVAKGETLLDTAANLDAMAPDCIVVRHSSAGVPHRLAKVSRAAIVNAGDGANEHPTQALLDAMTIREHKGQIDGLSVAIVGDIVHSRVARSNIHLLTKLGATVRVAGPRTLVPKDFSFLLHGQEFAVDKRPLEVCEHVEDAIRGADVVMILRIQRERQDSAYFPSLREYSIHYGLTNERLDLARRDAIVLHPGPMNRGIEIASDVADSSRSLILDQVKYGVAVRMAVLYLATGGNPASS
ncbi:MAG: aspartate carbamoyltransferase catalytic subunit [Acidobacteria bacterium ACB1]|nr:Aspartate carbamoyltransferase [Pyrinomonadaceae bacterium]MCE7960984.1 aspartate carbamoyltransferase catalytic subunit [Acidobacteria bacterium ACB1]